MTYEVKCKKCDFNETYNISLDEYSKLMTSECPLCHNISLYQNMNHEFRFQFSGITSGWMDKKGKMGSQLELDKALKENDHLHDLYKNNTGPKGE